MRVDTYSCSHTSISRRWAYWVWYFHQALADGVEIAGATGASLISRTGPVRLDSNGGNSSLLLGTDSLLATAETVTFRGYHGVGTSTSARTPPIEAHPLGGGAVEGGERRSTGGPDSNASGGFLKLTGELATLGGPWGASLDADDEVQCRKRTLRASSRH